MALAKEGPIDFALAEERLSRIKKDVAFPAKSLQAALDHEGLAYPDLDQVCFGWQRPGASFKHDLKCFLGGKVPPTKRFLVGSLRRYIREMNQNGGEVLLTRLTDRVRR